jgi:hypothetical protein
MKKLLSVIWAASLLLYPFAAFAEDYGSQTSQTLQVPPVAQTLVREGDFAIKLAATLNLGLPTDEASAEDMLAKAGVVPKNGWLSDYPVTPEIIGQLQDSIDKAASEGKLPMPAEEAKKNLSYLAAQMNLPYPAGPQTPAQENETVPSMPPDLQMVDQYYYDQGPPVITYYPPPVYYGYLYDWVPYPVYWYGFWFPGFYICNSFTRVIVVNHSPVIVSNHVIDRHSRRVVTVDPVTRTSSGTIHPETTLRTHDGRTFRNLADLRHGVSITGPQTYRSEISANGMPRAGGTWTAHARRSAGAIYSRSLERMRTGMAPEGAVARSGARQLIAPSAPGRSYNGTFRGGTMRFIAPAGSQRAPRPLTLRGSSESARPFISSRGSLVGGERGFVGPTAPTRTFTGGSRHSTGPINGNGWHGR